MSSDRNKTMVALELCWWEQTRLVMDEVFRKPRLTGTFPFTTGYNIRLWPSVVLVIIVIASSLLSIIFRPNMELEEGSIDVKFLRTLKGVIATLYNIASPLWMVYNHKYLIKLLRLVASVEKELDQASEKWTWKQSLLPFFLLPIIATVITIIQCMSIIPNNDFLSAFSFIMVVICSYPTMSYIWQYLALHDVLRSLMIRIGNLNDADSFVSCYHSSVLAYRTIDKLYGFQVMVYFIMAMGSILHSLHQIFIDKGFYFMTACQIFWVSFYLAIVLLIIRRCNSSVEQSKMVNEQLYKRMVYEDNNKLLNDKLLAFHLSSCRKLAFTACGFFNLDNSLICSMIACATTYLVIMLQYTLPIEIHIHLNQSFANI